jgi:hypothetical protein
VSVYQAGLSFYTQSCKEMPDNWRCKWYAVWPFKHTESKYFSEDLQISFKTPADYDERTSYEKLRDAVLIHDNFLNWLGKVFSWSP